MRNMNRVAPSSGPKLLSTMSMVGKMRGMPSNCNKSCIVTPNPNILALISIFNLVFPILSLNKDKILQAGQEPERLHELR